MIAQLRDDARFASALSSDLHDLRVEYTRLFTLNVYPYASVFLDVEGVLNTATTARVQRAYEQAGFQLDAALPIGASDHFGAELLFVAHLLEHKRNEAAQTFLRDEIAAWAIIFLPAVEQNARAEFYRTLARETLKWVCANIAPLDYAPSPPITDLPDPSLDEQNLNSIVAYLLSPARSGIFLRKDDLTRIARETGLPVRFGDRTGMVRSLFIAAGESQSVQLLLPTLQMETQRWLERYMIAEKENPSMATSARAWLDRAQRTSVYLERMRDAL